MDQQSFKKIFKHLSSIDRTLASMDKTLALQEQSLAEHMKRTNLLELKLEPVEAHVEQVRGVGKFLLYISVVATIVAGLYAALSYIRG